MPHDPEFESQHPRGRSGRFVAKPRAVPADIGSPISVAQNPRTSQSELAVLASHRDPLVRAAVAGNPNAPAGSLKKLASDEDVYVRKRAAENPSTPVVSLTELAHDEHWEVRECVAKNPSSTPEIMRILWGDADEDVRWRVASHDATPADVVNDLAENDECHFVVCTAVWHDAADTERLIPKLAAHKNWRVREYLAGIADLPEEILRTLTEDEDVYVQDRALLTLESIGQNPQERPSEDARSVVSSTRTWTTTIYQTHDMRPRVVIVKSKKGEHTYTIQRTDGSVEAVGQPSRNHGTALARGIHHATTGQPTRKPFQEMVAPASSESTSC